MKPLAGHHRIVIVGAGFSGLGMAIRLKQRGIDDFVVLERQSEVGGVWQCSTFPGLACDIRSHLYSFSFAPNPDWSHTYAPQPQIRDYLRDCVEDSASARTSSPQVELQAASGTTSTAGCGRSTPPPGAARRTCDLRDGAVDRAQAARRPRHRDLRRQDDPHRPLGSTTTSSRASAWHRSARAPQPSSTCPTIQPLVERLYLIQRTAPWVVPASAGRSATSSASCSGRVPTAQRLMRAGIVPQTRAARASLSEEAHADEPRNASPTAQTGQISDPGARRSTAEPRVGQAYAGHRTADRGVPS